MRPFADAGFDEIAPVQIGGESRPEFIDWASRTLLPALHDALCRRRALPTSREQLRRGHRRRCAE